MQTLVRAALALLAASAVGCSAGGESTDAASSRSSAMTVGASAASTTLVIGGRAQERTAASVLISGHSLTDPLPEPLVTIARSLGTTIEWNRQSVPGSSIRVRTRGVDETQGPWAGYRSGFNRDGENMDVLAELRAPRTISTARYDVLLITEQHGLLGTLVWNDTVRHLRHFHERFIEANPTGSTYFYAPWISLDDTSDPRRWIAYERAAAPIWECVATRVNTSLEHEGRPDRIVTIPAGLALAELVARATSAGGVPGVTRGSVRETIEALFIDGVHVSELGGYFVALVTYASIYQRSPLGAAAPPSIDAPTARALQQLAWDFVVAYYGNSRPLTLEQCRERIVSGFNQMYWSYQRDLGFAKEDGPLLAFAKVTRLRWQWQRRFGSLDSGNPFYFDAATDGDYWLRS